ncbi:hypothetical protein KR032_006589 [Drosophila birchii]|nr:hypothetical protein KR032_006589 [Drosophila birchii]
MSFQKQLNDFNRKLDMPPWYLGISILQEETIYSMHEKLRDDYEQGSGSTMYRALVVLGVKPVISTRLLRRLVQLSKNNILAFLFFALEGYYKTCRPKGSNVYSVNEQLLMIAISRIDLLPTLRALDEILPQPSQLQLQKMKQYNRAARPKAQVRGTKSPIIVESRPKKLSNISPYFLKQPRPVSRISNATHQQSDFVVQFKFWPRNGPPNYGAEPEEPWFAQYHPNPGMRLIKKTLSEALEKYFKSGHDDITSHKNEDGDGDEAKSGEPQPNLCLAHRMRMTQEQLLRDELVVKARNRCLELLDVTQPYSKIRQRRIVAQLENDIDMVLDRHTREMQCDQTKVFTIENTDCVLCQHMLVSQPWPEPNDQVGRALVGEDCGMAHTAALDTYCGRRLEGGAGKGKKGKDKKGKKDKVKEPEPQPPEEPPKEEPKKKVPEWKPPPVKRHHEPFRITNIDFKEKLKKCLPPQNVSECEVPPAPKKSAVSFALAMGKIGKRGQKCDIQQTVKKVVKKKFFRASKPNKPYQFKYHRVFQSGQPRPFDLNRVVTKTFVKALNKSDSEDRNEGLIPSKPVSEMQLAEGLPPPQEAQLESVPQPAPNLQEKLNDDLFGDDKTERDSRETLDRSSNHSRRSHIDYKAQIVEAVMECANTIFHKQAAIKRAEMEHQERTVKKKTPYFKEDEEYDPDNVDQMNQLLKDGLRILSRQPRYVLASLPDSHKLPVMREWIKRRYGKAYTQKELKTNMAESTRIFELVTLVQGTLPVLNLQGLEKLPKSQENFDHYKEIKKTATDVKRDYHTQLNEQYMNSISSAWYAMGNYLVPSGPPRRTFFAYLASNPNEIMRAKTWNGDFRNYRQLRDNRRQMEKN